VDAFAAAGLPVRIVLGPALAAHCAVLPDGVEVVWNARWTSTEMADSVAIGLSGLGEVLLTPVDVPPAAPATLAALLAAEGPAVPTWQGQDGHPVRLAPPHVGGLRERLRGAARVPVADPEVLSNLNRPADWEAWLRRTGA
jgi:CTP:molybdopterin cytidylyltransferase MocA